MEQALARNLIYVRVFYFNKIKNVTRFFLTKNHVNMAVPINLIVIIITITHYYYYYYHHYYIIILLLLLLSLLLFLLLLLTSYSPNLFIKKYATAELLK